MPTQTYEARLIWQAGGEGITAGNHRLEFEGRPAVEVSAAPQYRGDPTRLNPEELFIAALASCQLLTDLAPARGAGVAVRRYEERATGTLAIADRKMRIDRGPAASSHDGCRGKRRGGGARAGRQGARRLLHRQLGGLRSPNRARDRRRGLSPLPLVCCLTG